MLNFRYSILLILILSTHLFNFAVVQRDNSTSYDELRGNDIDRSSQNLSGQEIDLDEDDDLDLEVMQRIEFYRKEREASKRIKKLKTELGELVFKRFVLKTKNRNNNKKSIKSKIDSQDWSNELFCGFATFATLFFYLYKYYKDDDNVSYN